MSKDDQRDAEVVWPTCVDETRVAVVMMLSKRRRFVEKPPMWECCLYEVHHHGSALNLHNSIP
jgi:hypothetical protein